MAVVLQPHQLTAISKMHNGCVLKGGVGTGKTPTSLGYYWLHVLGGKLNDWASVSPDNAVDLYIFTTARKRDTLDWQIWAAKFGIHEDPAISVGGIRLVVESYNNMVKYKLVKGAFIIMDEQRLVGSGLWAKTFQLMAKSNDWIMLSATPADKWEDYIPLFIANGFYKNRTEFVRDHCVYSHFGSYPKLERYVGVNKLVKLKHQILVEMPYQRHTVRHLIEVPVSYDKELFNIVKEDRWNPYEERPLRDVAELCAVMRRVVNSDTSRTEAIKSLMQTHPRLIVYYNFNYELEMLRSLAASLTSPASSISPLPTTGLLPVMESDPWIDTIWAKNFVPPKGEKDPREKLGNIKAKAEYEIKSNRTASSTTSTSTTTGSHILSGARSGSSRNSQPTSAASRRSSFVAAEWNGQKHENVPDSDSWLYLVQYQAGAEAWNCTTTDAMSFFSLTYSYRFFEQSQGRIDRLDTPFTNLKYYPLVSTSFIDMMIKRALMNKENFNEKDLKDLAKLFKG